MTRSALALLLCTACPGPESKERRDTSRSTATTPPEEGCATGEVLDGEVCVPEACGVGTWGNLPVDEETVYVRAGDTGDGTENSPLGSIQVAVDLAGNRVISGLNADSRLTPASLTKLTITAAALETWPADKAFKTQLLTATRVQNGELPGDLVLQGAGDPSLDDHSLWSLAAQLRGAGITTIRGRLIVNAAPFGLVACETEDRCNRNFVREFWS